MALNFRLFNCDRTFSLDKVEALIQRVAAKLSRETKIEKTYFPLPRMNELCEELEKGDSHFEYAVFVVHANESRLSINEKNAGLGYTKVYRALQKVTGDRVLIVIGGDDNYKDQEERDKSVLSRWVLNKLRSQFTEDYYSGMKSFIFSWEDNHRPIHEEALEFYLPKKFAPRSIQSAAKVPEKEGTKETEEAKRLELMKQESQAAKLLEEERPFYKASISYGRVFEVLKSDPRGWRPDSLHMNNLLLRNQSVKKATIEFWYEGDELKSACRPSEANLYKIAEGVATDKMYSILVYSYHAEEETNDELSKVILHLGVPELSPCQPIEPASFMTDIRCIRPDYVMFSADIDALKDEDKVRRVKQEYGATMKEITEKCVGEGVIIMLFGDTSYKEGEFASKETTQYVRRLSQGIVPPDRLTVMTCKDRPYTTHQEWMKQTLLKPKGATQSASQGTQYYYKAVIEKGQISKVLEHIPPDWKPDDGIVRRKLQENKRARIAYLEIFGNDKGEIEKIAVQDKLKGAVFYARSLFTNPTSLLSSDNSDEV